MVLTSTTILKKNYYSKGSVVVEFQVVFKKKMDDPLRPLRRCAMENNFRIFKVDPKSVKEES